MDWSEDHDVIFCREIVASDLFKLKPGSRERGSCLEKNCKLFNFFWKNHGLIVDQRSLRDRIKKLLAQFIKKKNEEEKASGIDVESTELNELLREIYDKKHEQELNLTNENNEKSNKAEEEKQSADNVRNRSMERLSETRKRESMLGEEETPRKVPRSSGNSTISYLREKAEKDFTLKERELQLREQELQLSIRRHEVLENQSQQ